MAIKWLRGDTFIVLYSIPFHSVPFYSIQSNSSQFNSMAYLCLRRRRGYGCFISAMLFWTMHNGYIYLTYKISKQINMHELTDFQLFQRNQIIRTTFNIKHIIYIEWIMHYVQTLLSGAHFHLIKFNSAHQLFYEFIILVLGPAHTSSQSLFLFFHLNCSTILSHHAGDWYGWLGNSSSSNNRWKNGTKLFRHIWILH